MKAFTDSWVDKFATVYADSPLAELSWFTASPGIELIKLVIDGVIRRGDRVVDLGSGPGVDAVFLAAQGMDVTGVDLSEQAVERARAWADLAGVSARFIQGDALDVPLPSHQADVVTDSFVFHNMRDEARPVYAAEVHRLLRPGGLFVLNSFSDHMVEGTGPRRVTSAEILATFDSNRFECVELRLYRNLPTATKPNQVHWIGQFRAR
ncbi:class I SAM-dependent methyltransferase [Saccharothrix coeruleofusca]|uniref:SAM-dependent methyltransferase n=1 Tax=Saccharothrix coeruleofusca TaxID=33919 RepID=A0A918AUB8_9PSEU|nr:class I SAM-dependent methyltransferase [Saccharothrix coeruleofusca]MBP2336002.1 ubiquinone/menaquinone biosynthesis C-methylase UbiE [Saccharothrix coeruleofusca]GGP76074.1 SAM-dependent methyltransferase [Saccharothrix coeruleofusca]